MILKINKHPFKVKTMISSHDTQEGMMNKKFDNSFNGMLFLMGDGDHGFWMKNCLLNLDIIFIKDKTITKIHHNCPPCNEEHCKSYIGNGNLVLELKGGTCKKLGIQEGDEITL